MLFRFFLLLILCSSSFACGIYGKEEPVAFVSMERYEELSEIAFYYPSKAEGAFADLVAVVIGEDDDESWMATVRTPALDAFEVEGRPELKDYSLSVFYLKKELFSKTTLIVEYRHRPEADGSVPMCGPLRYHKLTEIEIKNAV